MIKANRVILKISGELFQSGSDNINFNNYNRVAKQLIDIQSQTGVELAVVVGGGNIFRGRQADNDVDSNEADWMGMMATIINGVGLREAMIRNGAKDTRLMTSININQIAEPYIRPKGIHHLANKRIIIVAGGLGMPNFTTDSAVAQFASELSCDIILKASTVDGVYNSDPKQNPNATKYSNLSYQEALDQNLKVMDKTAFAMCEKSKIPIFVFNIASLNRIPEVISGNFSIGTLIS